MSEHLNEDVAGRLDEVAQLFAAQGANPFRVRAYKRAAETVRRLSRPVSEILEQEGLEGLTGCQASAKVSRVPSATWWLVVAWPCWKGFGARATPRRSWRRSPASAGSSPIACITTSRSRRSKTWKPPRTTGGSSTRWASARNVWRAFAIRWRTGSSVCGPHRPAAMERPRSSRFSTWTVNTATRRPPASSPKIAPRRFNPSRVAWLPILHTTRGRRHYTALFSNTALAHQLGRTNDWVVIYWDDGRGERQCTVVTARRGLLGGQRVVRGREVECLQLARKSAGGHSGASISRREPVQAAPSP